MPISIVRPLVWLALACAASLIPAASASATTVADFRVVNSVGQTLAEHTQFTGRVRIKTDPGAECFGPGTGGSGDPVTVRGATALGIVKDGSRYDRDLLPISVSDFFDFGLAICGFGGFEAPPGSWYLKQNHVEAMVGGDQVKLEDRDDVVWFLDPDFSDPPPEELGLKKVPVAAQPGVPFELKAIEYAPDGTVSPAAGAQVTGAATPTDSQGRTMVTLAKSTTIRATRSGDIPSPGLRVCVNLVPASCPSERGLLIVGSNRADSISARSGPDRVLARGGNDAVRAVGGDADNINCGKGRRDKARVDAADSVSNCEEVLKEA